MKRPSWLRLRPRGKEPDGGPPTGVRAPAETGKEFEGLLREAEGLLWSVHGGGRRLLVLRCLQAALVVAPALVLLVAEKQLAALAALLAAAALGTVAEVYAIRPIVRTRAGQLAELTELVDMLREVLVHLSKQERWPARRVRDARDRLARFSVEQRGGLW